MRFVTFQTAESAPRPGVLSLDRSSVIDLGAHFPDMLSLMDRGREGLDIARDFQAKGGLSHPLDKVQLRAPVPRPRQMRDFMCSAQHARDGSRGMARLKAKLANQPPPDINSINFPEVYKQLPVFYFTNRNSVSGPDDDILWPRYSSFLDYELELGVFIGREGKNISVADAGAHIFGYTIFNDFSARDRQAHEMTGFLGPAKGKSFDTGNAIGPWIVTPDEIQNVYDLDVQVRVNGEVWARGSTAEKFHTFEETIAFVSEDETLVVGEMFGSGTMGGCCGLEIDRWLKHGDVLELEVSGIGVLRNRIVRQ